MTLTEIPIILAAGGAISRFRISDWAVSIPVIAFLLCFIAFIIFSIKAIKMSDSKSRQMANLPLNEETLVEEKHEKGQ